jgi:hypothetical protein
MLGQAREVYLRLVDRLRGELERAELHPDAVPRPETVVGADISHHA